MGTNYCVSCGQEIPEGDMVCNACHSETLDERSRRVINAINNGEIIDKFHGASFTAEAKDEKAARILNSANNNVVIKHWDGLKWSKPKAGDIIMLFGHEFEVLANEPGNVVFKLLVSVAQQAVVK